MFKLKFAFRAFCQKGFLCAFLIMAKNLIRADNKTTDSPCNQLFQFLEQFKTSKKRKATYKQTKSQFCYWNFVLFFLYCFRTFLNGNKI